MFSLRSFKHLLLLVIHTIMRYSGEQFDSIPNKIQYLMLICIIYVMHVHLRELLGEIHQAGGISAACWFCYFESTSSAGHLKRSIVPRFSGRQNRVVSSFTDICLSQWCFPPSRHRQEGKPPEILIVRIALVYLRLTKGSSHRLSSSIWRFGIR